VAGVEGVFAGAGDEEGEHDSEVDDDELAVVGAATEEEEMVDEGPGDEEVDEGPERGPAGGDAEDEERHADGVGDDGEGEAGEGPIWSGLGKCADMAWKFWIFSRPWRRKSEVGTVRRRASRPRSRVLVRKKRAGMTTGYMGSWV